MTDKIKRTIGVLAALAALALGGAAIAGASGGGGGGATSDQAQGSPAADNHADGETNDDPGAAQKDGAEHGESANDADGSPQAEASE